MDPRIIKTEVFQTPDGKTHDTEEDAVHHLAATDYGEIIEEFITWCGDKNEYSEKHRSAMRNTLRAFIGWQKVKGFAVSTKPDLPPPTPLSEVAGQEETRSSVPDESDHIVDRPDPPRV